MFMFLFPVIRVITKKLGPSEMGANVVAVVVYQTILPAL